MSLNHKPRRGDKVNDRNRTHANGFVQRILYDDGPSEVLVKYDDGMEFYSYSEFEYTYTDHFGGVFIIPLERRKRMDFKVKVTAIYTYEGDEATAEKIAETERQAIIDGEVSFEDMVATGGCDLKVEVTEVVEAE